MRTFTQQHLLRIGARDLCGLASVEETTADLSALADCVLQAGLEACVRWLTALYGVPMYTDADGVQQPCGFCVIGMGKLGGYELNFSSDVDLMYVYTSYEGSTSGLGANGEVQQQISNHEYFVSPGTPSHDTDWGPGAGGAGVPCRPAPASGGYAGAVGALPPVL